MKSGFEMASRERFSVSPSPSDMSASAQILVVDDELPLRNFISRNLSARGFQVSSAANGLEAIAVFSTEAPDLIILDIMMPEMDGLETCRRIRQTSTVPILVLTALGDEASKVKALDLGADDYLTKPFGVKELLARVRAILRRASWESNALPEQVIQYGDLRLDPQAQKVTCRNQPVRLTRTEFNLLHYFMTHAGKVLTHRALLRHVWGREYGGETEYLRVYVGRLRKKIEIDASKPAYFITEHGVGYRFGE